jgi:hypothetical protein
MVRGITIMAVNKDNLVKIIRYLFDMVYEMEKDGETSDRH